MNLGDVLQGSGATVYRTTSSGIRQGLLSPKELATEIAGFTTDSRDCSEGTMFVALHGERTDGHAHVTEAMGRGAAVCIVENIPSAKFPSDRYLLVCKSSVRSIQDLGRFWREKHSVTVVGVTGSVGKTTVKESVYQALAPLGQEAVFKSAGNRNSEVSLPLELLKLNKNHKFAVLEMGMYDKGDIALLCDIARPCIGVVTSVRNNHLERTGSIERTAQAKAELVHALPANGLAILNEDDVWVSAMKFATSAPSVGYGIERKRDFQASNIQGLGRRGFYTVIHHGSRHLKVSCPTPGKHNAMNLLPAAAVAHHAGVRWELIGEALRQFRLESRACFLPGINSSTILDDRYNASSDSTLAALDLLKEEPSRHLALLGEMLELGNQEEAEHRAVGARCADLAGLILLGGRTEWIADEAESAGMPREKIFRVDDNERAIEAAQELLKPGDVMLVKGSRGLQLETVVAALTEVVVE